LHTRNLTDVLPEAKATNSWDCGVNIQTSAATPEIVNRFHKNGQLVMVWIDKNATPDEGPDLWKQIIESGVDCFCTDFPLEFMLYKDKYLSSRASISSSNCPIYA
jgi:glycerophosphoryl diester phosphodiesterase